MKIIYRINKINENYEKEIISQDVMLVDSREEFKEAIRLTFGDNIKFRATEDMQPNSIYIQIISYDCYNAEEYLILQDYVCACCNKPFKAHKHSLITFTSGWWLKQICEPLFNAREQELSSLVYCSLKCKYKHEEDLKLEFLQYGKDNDLLSNEWVSRYAFDEKYITGKGYIYLITKKSTGEWYVGQTNSIPMFRWVQHLKTDRFNVENIIDYRYEILEEVNDLTQLNEREAYWINFYYKNVDKDKCLNKIIPKYEKGDI